MKKHTATPRTQKPRTSSPVAPDTQITDKRFAAIESRLDDLEYQFFKDGKAIEPGSGRRRAPRDANATTETK